MTTDYVLLLSHLAVHVAQPAHARLGAMQDLRIAGDTDYESVLTTNCLSSFPTALFRLTKLTSLSLSSRGLCCFYSALLKSPLGRSLRSSSMSVQV